MSPRQNANNASTLKLSYQYIHHTSFRPCQSAAPTNTAHTHTQNSLIGSCCGVSTETHMQTHIDSHRAMRVPNSFASSIVDSWNPRNPDFRAVLRVSGFGYSEIRKSYKMNMVISAGTFSVDEVTPYLFFFRRMLNWLGMLFSTDKMPPAESCHMGDVSKPFGQGGLVCKFALQHECTTLYNLQL